LLLSSKVRRDASYKKIPTGNPKTMRGWTT
jgi:hypothetical protein